MLNVTDIKVNNGSLSMIIIMPHKLIAPRTGTGNLLSDMDKITVEVTTVVLGGEWHVIY